MAMSSFGLKPIVFFLAFSSSLFFFFFVMPAASIGILPSTDLDNARSLQWLQLDGHLSFDKLHRAAGDFGGTRHDPPLVVLHPKSAFDVAAVVKRVYKMGAQSGLTVAARGHAHSLHGQAQAPGGIVVDMESLRGSGMQVHADGELPHIDVSAGELWIDVLQESLKHGLSPKSWTDYLHLTVGGTLSAAGISGQAYKFGPQISNVQELQIVTGKGEILNCSPSNHNADLFYGALGGLGQFGIITRARISLQTAPKMVKWIKVLYSDFSQFTKDQEKVISGEASFDYVEGFVITNWSGHWSNWRSSFHGHGHVLSLLQPPSLESNGRTLFCLELAKHFNPDDNNDTDQEVKIVLSQLSYIPSMLFMSEVPFVEFLDRVHASEMKLRSKGLWEVPHPWMNLLIPRAKIHEFARKVFQNILTNESNDPVLIYPVNKSKWDSRTSAVIPGGDDVFYLVAFLSSAAPSSSAGPNSLEQLLKRNRRILNFCESAGIGMKQYLPHYTTTQEWQKHFGRRWEEFLRRKSAYDPSAILAPGQRIFRRRHHSAAAGMNTVL